MAAPKSADTFLTTEQLAKHWKLAPNTLINWRSQGLGPKFMKFGDTKRAPVRYRVSDIIEYEHTLMEGGKAFIVPTEAEPKPRKKKR